MTINVHTYYRNRLALEEAVERARMRQEMAVRYATPVRVASAPHRPIAIPVMVVYGILVGLAYAAWVWLCMGTGQPAGLLAAMGLMWGLIWGLFFHVNRVRIADFLQALTAEPAPAAFLVSDEDELDLSWMNSNKAPAAAWTPPPAPMTLLEQQPMSTFPKPNAPAKQPNTTLEQPKTPAMGSMLNQLTETLGETPEPKSLPPKAKVWGTPVEMARTGH